MTQDETATGQGSAARPEFFSQVRETYLSADVR